VKSRRRNPCNSHSTLWMLLLQKKFQNMKTSHLLMNIPQIMTNKRNTRKNYQAIDLQTCQTLKRKTTMRIINNFQT
jgi:hypothetical protein